MPLITLKSPPQAVPQKVDTTGDVKAGGEGAVFFSRDGKYAIKIYHRPSPQKEQLLQLIMKLFQSLPTEQQQFILPPLALVDRVDGTPRIGFLMRRVPPSHRELVDFVLNPVVAAEHFKNGKRWTHYLKIARKVASAIAILHGKGCAHSDIHFRNFLVNLEQGDAVMLEIDGVVVSGFLPAQVKGMLGFMAPEILTSGASPSERTDRHSLAVLILHTLLFRNTMQPLIEYDGDQNRSEELGWGKYALFSEHSSDHRHRPRNLGVPLYRKGALSYRMLTPALQQLTERALIDGLHAPDRRPSSREWDEALAWTVDEIWTCLRCHQNFPYQYWLSPPSRRSCPFCGQRISPPFPSVLELYEERSRHNFIRIGRHLVLGDSFRVFRDVTELGRRPPTTRVREPSVGHAEWDRRGKRYQLVNDQDAAWTARVPGRGQLLLIQKGSSVVLESGTWIRFGNGKRMAVVVE